MEHTVEEISQKIVSLGEFRRFESGVWAMRLHGCAVPYFYVAYTPMGHRFRLLLLEGWQTFHDFLRFREDRESGFVSEVQELPHYEVDYYIGGDYRLSRYDPGSGGTNLDERGRLVVAKLLWEVYGVMLRMETDEKLLYRYAADRALFARVEDADGKWRDAPLEIPPPRSLDESVAVKKDVLKQVKDLPECPDAALEFDMRFQPAYRSPHGVPLAIYFQMAVDAKTGAIVDYGVLFLRPEMGLRELWLSLADRLLVALQKWGKVPGEVRVSSSRVYRMLRPLCSELSFKLVKYPELEHYRETEWRVMSKVGNP